MNKHAANRSALGHYADNMPNQAFATDLSLESIFMRQD